MLRKLYKAIKLMVNNRYVNNGWISINTPPRRAHLGNFLVIVKKSDTHTFRYDIWMSSYSNFVKAGESFDCWRKNAENTVTSCSAISKDKVVYWRPLPKLPQSIRKHSCEGYWEDPTDFLKTR